MAANSEEKAHRPAEPKRARTLSSARLAAVQAIYQMEMTGVGADPVVAEFIHYRAGAELDESGQAIETDKALFVELVRGVARMREELDRMIASLLVKEWPLERLEKVMASILRAGAFELMERTGVPARVVISEYVDIAHAFFEGKELGMVNGVLDRLARILREAEMGAPGAEPTSGRRPAG